MIGDDKHLGRRAKPVVGIGKETRIDVSVWADDRQIAHGAVQRMGDACLAAIRARHPAMKLGAGTGRTFDLAAMRYGRVILMADADVDVDVDVDTDVDTDTDVDGIPVYASVADAAEATGAFAACLTVVALSRPLRHGLSNLLETKTARAYAAGGIEQLRRFVRKTTLLMALSVGAFALAVAVCGQFAVDLMFGNQFADCGWLMVVLAGLVLLTVTAMAEDGRK